MAMLTENVIDFVQHLFEGKIPSLREADKASLIESKMEIQPFLSSVLSKEIPLLTQEGTCSNPTALFWSLELSGLLKAESSFDWLRLLCRIPTEVLCHNLGLEFVTENLSYLLANVAGCRWSLLKAEIEDSSLDEFIRAAGLEALVFLVINKVVKRFDIISYFYSLFQRMLDQKLNDVALATHLSMSCVRLWPGECIEEIREFFGLGLIDAHFLSLPHTLTYVNAGKEFCLEDTRLRMLRQSPLFHPFSSSFSKDPEEELCSMLKRVWQLRLEMRSPHPAVCKTQKTLKQSSSHALVLESIRTTLTYDLTHCLTSPVSPVDQASILSLCSISPGNLATISTYLSLYPNLPFLHYILYKTYQSIKKHHEALEVLKHMLYQFPEYAMSKIEYSLYLIRKGEGKKACAVLGNAQTLADLYPKRSHFHISEWVGFLYVTGHCFLQMEKEKQVKTYLDLLHMLAPKSAEYKDLHSKVKH